MCFCFKHSRPEGALRMRVARYVPTRPGHASKRTMLALRHSGHTRFASRRIRARGCVHTGLVQAQVILAQVQARRHTTVYQLQLATQPRPSFHHKKARHSPPATTHQALHTCGVSSVKLKRSHRTQWGGSPPPQVTCQDSGAV